MVQEELNGTRKDKFMLQAKVGELRNSMKTVLQQNNQLKQDLKNSRLRKVRLMLIFILNIDNMYICKCVIFYHISVTTSADGSKGGINPSDASKNPRLPCSCFTFGRTVEALNVRQ